ncbi:MAG: hypothetical protein ABMB14_03760 [Myxococcota bacterium]
MSRAPTSLGLSVGLALALAWLAGCSGDGSDTGVPSCGDATWDGFVEPTLTTWCTPCHSSELTGDDRRGAPVGTDFDTWAGANYYANLIASVAGPGDPYMPPAGGMPEADRALLAAWAACDAPGPVDEPGPCDVRVEHLGDATAAGEPCAAGATAVTGTLTVGSDPGVALDCVCEVDGDLVITGPVALPLLQRVGGAIRVEGAGATAVSLPALATAGSLSITDAALATLDLSALTAVDAAVFVVRGVLPATFEPARLTTVGTTLALRQVDGVTTVDLPRLESVGEDLVLDGLPALTSVVHTSDLVTIGGSLRLVNNPALRTVEDFEFVETIGGDLELGGGGDLRSVVALWTVSRVTGDLTIRDEPRLGSVQGFESLSQIGGTLRVVSVGAAGVSGFDALDQLGGIEVIGNRNLATWATGEVSVVAGSVTVVDNPVLPVLPAIDGVDSIGGAVQIAGMDALAGGGALGEVVSIPGDLQVVDNAALQNLGMPSLGQVGGDLTLEQNAALSSLQGWSALDTVSGDVTVRSNPALPDAAIGAWLGGIDVGGATTVDGNGG